MAARRRRRAARIAGDPPRSGGRRQVAARGGAGRWLACEGMSEATGARSGSGTSRTPRCPFAFSAERQRLRLEWLYGDQIAWSIHLVVLREEPSPEWRGSDGYRRLQGRYGMPIDWSPRPRLSATVHACRAVVAARVRAPAGARRCCAACGSSPSPATCWTSRPRSSAPRARPASTPRRSAPGWRSRRWRPRCARTCAPPAARRRRRARRTTSSAARPRSGATRARATSSSGSTRRRTDWPTAGRVDLPGYRPIEAYEAALANLAPELRRREDPGDVEAVLAWAGMPLATAEVAAVCDRDIPDVRMELARAAVFEPVGGDGYWSLA